MPEILELADRVTVMRDGRLVATREIAGVTAAGLVELMTDLYTDAEFAPPTVFDCAMAGRVAG